MAAPRRSDGAPSGAPSNILEAHELGFSVFPVKPGTKAPLLEWTPFQKQRASREQVEKWAATATAYGIACGPASGIVAIDTDDAQAEEWAIQHLPKTPCMTKTPKGVHRFYRAPANGKFGNRNKVFLDDGRELNMDVRGEGGYVLGPGSAHPDGGTYRAFGAWASALDGLPVYDPAWFGQGLGERQKRPATVTPLRPVSIFDNASRWMKERAPAIQGQGGDNHTFSTACALWDFGLTEGEVFSLLAEWNQICSPPWSEKELWDKVRSAQKHRQAPLYPKNAQPERQQRTPTSSLPAAPAPAADPEEIPAPKPLQTNRAPEMDISFLPKPCAEIVKVMAYKMEIPPEFLVFALLGLLSSILQGEFEVEIDSTHVQPLPLWWLAFGKPGEGKSPALRVIMGPANRWEREATAAAKQHIDRARARQSVLEIKAEQARKFLQRNPNNPDALAALEQATVDLGNHVVPSPPSLTFGDVTTESLGRELIAQKGRGAVISAEAGIIDNMAGRYGAGRPNIDLWLAGFDRDPHRLHRTKRESEDIQGVLLTLSLMVQPRVWPSLLAEEFLRNKGTYDRFFFAYPDSRLGMREHHDFEVPAGVLQEYSDLILGILRSYRGDGSLPPGQRKLTLCPAGRAFFTEMKRKLEPLMAEGNRFEAISGWVSKLPGKLVRLAALLFIAERMPAGPTVLPLEYLKKAFALAESYLIPHAERAFGIVPEDVDAENARRILSRLLRRKETTFARSVVNRIADLPAESLEPALDLLTDRHWLIPMENRSTGGRPKLTYLVNPGAAQSFGRREVTASPPPSKPPAPSRETWEDRCEEAALEDLWN